MTEKSDEKLLKHLFVAEIEGRLPFQGRGKWLERLSSKGYIEPMAVRLGGNYPVTIKGWQLTHLGRLTYCISCDEPQSQSQRKEEK